MSKLGCSYCGKHAINLSHLCICDNISEEKPTYEELEAKIKELEAENKKLKAELAESYEDTERQVNEALEGR